MNDEVSYLNFIIHHSSLAMNTNRPLAWVPRAPAAFLLMGPGHALCGWRSGRERRQLQAELAAGAVSEQIS